jgi:hypothetical protein
MRSHSTEHYGERAFEMLHHTSRNGHAHEAHSNGTTLLAAPRS